MHRVKSCGVLVLREAPQRAFLLMKHPKRYDLPKGHMNAGETEIECALRELHEETGIAKGDIELDPVFRYEETYHPSYSRFGNEVVEKTLVVFLGRLLRDARVVPSEHEGFEWVDWAPPHRIQTRVIDGLIGRLERHLAQAAGV